MSDSKSGSDLFPPGFVWGAATSSYQIEGAATADGKAASIWDTFCNVPGVVKNGDNGQLACDHYHRFRDDVALMQQIGLGAYRFSISWSRVLPAGEGEPNKAGLTFYDRLVDALLAAGVEPWVTLFHWDYPQELYDRGGWLNPASVEWFANYTRAVVERLSDRVQNWFTLNEPQVFVHLAMNDAIHAPGKKFSLSEQLQVAHHALQAHGRSVQVIREFARRSPHVGWAPVGISKVPASRAISGANAEEVEAARRATMDIREPNLWNNTWYNDAVLLGRYPEDGLRTYGKAVPQTTEQQLQLISTPVDFLGLNIYTATPVRPATNDSACTRGYEELGYPAGFPQTAFEWPVVEEALYWGPRFHYERYQKPIVITENGMANVDWVAADGQVHDPQRIDYTQRYLRCLAQAVADGVRVDGYFHWSLLDNFEWAEGYSKRFGLVYVDFSTRERIPKDSARWYSEVIRSNDESLRALGADDPQRPSFLAK